MPFQNIANRLARDGFEGGMRGVYQEEVAKQECIARWCGRRSDFWAVPRRRSGLQTLLSIFYCRA